MKDSARRPLIAGNRVGQTKAAGACMRSLMAAALVFLLAVPFSEAADVLPQQNGQQQAEAVPPAPEASQAPPDAPQPATGQVTTNEPPTSTPQQTSAAQQQQPGTLGTAAAPVETPVGVPGSKPAGAVIAPAKQRRTRSFGIRVAILVGAIVGVGTVVALSNASPARPH